MSRAVVTQAYRLAPQVNGRQVARLDELARARQRAWNWALTTLEDLWSLDRCVDRLRAVDQKGQPYRHIDKFTLIILFNQNKGSLGWTVEIPTWSSSMPSRT